MPSFACHFARWSLESEEQASVTCKQKLSDGFICLTNLMTCNTFGNGVTVAQQPLELFV